MESKKDYVNRIYRLALFAGVVANKKEFAELLEINRSGLSAALNGNERNLTDRFVRKVQKFAEAHNLEGDAPFVPETEQPKKSKTIEIPEETLELYTSLAKSVDRLSAMVERMMPGASVYGTGVFGGVSSQTDHRK